MEMERKASNNSGTTSKEISHSEDELDSPTINRKVSKKSSKETDKHGNYLENV
jgi:hypothetical protein